MHDGYVDTIARYGPTIYERSGVASAANQYAAMPSLHFGWAVLVAYGVVRALRGPWRWLVVLHPVVTLAAIVLTANHYWLDALAALALVALALVAAPPGARWHPADAPPTVEPARSPTRSRAGERYLLGGRRDGQGADSGVWRCRASSSRS